MTHVIKNISTILLFAFSMLTALSVGQTNNKQVPFDNKKFAQTVLKRALASDTASRPRNQSIQLLKDSVSTIKIAEQILFDFYGREQILTEKPYNLFYLDNYWVMFGTVHTRHGGPFVIVIDSYDCRVLAMYHEK